ncbi:MAG: aspartyl/asparaginyl beta-hydroxylase domain-containing protein [Xanthomonadales bacterium]|nr:aspartyl/asparaginyl beta-hydroxylase domain-containing protein [Xanthomonadales bacterium]
MSASAEASRSPPAVARAAELLRGGRAAEGLAMLGAVLADNPRQAHALLQLALYHRGRGETGAAFDYATRAAAGDPPLALAAALLGSLLGERGELAAAEAAFREALLRDPSFLPARLELAELLDRTGHAREASRLSREAIAAVPPEATLPPPLAALMARARERVLREERELEEFLRERLAVPLAALPPEDRRRAEECFEITRGRLQPKVPRPGFLFFPGLPTFGFYPRRLFPWMAALEARWREIREEAERVLTEQEGRFVPYVQKDASEAGPGSPWAALNRNRDWGVYFLFNQGERVEAHCAACPRTAEALAGLPLVDIPGRGPTAFFSRLRPGTHIPPHHGATNTRLIVHLGLIVPEGCGFRVGNETRSWREGECFAFDDTVEHEAWNRGSGTRTVLIFDVWNPYLDEAERAFVRALSAAYAAFYPERQHQLDF